MKCPNCGHENEGGRFCENCGKQLVDTAESQVQQQAIPQANHENTDSSQTEDYLKKTKDQSKQYINYFIDVLKKPYVSLHSSIESQHFIHAIITLVLYCLLIPLMMYFGVKGLINNINLLEEVDITLPFMDMVFKPFLAYAILMVLVVAFTFVSIKLGRVNVTFKEVLTRYGILLIPFVLILAIGLILSILNVSMFVIFLAIGLIGSMYVAVPVLIAFYKKNNPGEGLDVVYGTLLTYILTSIAMLIMGEILFDSLIETIKTYIEGPGSYWDY